MFWLSPSPASLNVADSTPAWEMLEVANTKCGLAGVSRDSSDSRAGRDLPARRGADGPRRANSRERTNILLSPSGEFGLRCRSGQSPPRADRRRTERALAGVGCAASYGGPTQQDARRNERLWRFVVVVH